MERRSLLLCTVLSCLMAISASCLTISTAYHKNPKQAYRTSDLNKDGIERLVNRNRRLG